MGGRATRWEEVRGEWGGAGGGREEGGGGGREVEGGTQFITYLRKLSTQFSLPTRVSAPAPAYARRSAVFIVGDVPHVNPTA
jgi:hypothetical protein